MAFYYEKGFWFVVSEMKGRCVSKLAGEAGR